MIDIDEVVLNACSTHMPSVCGEYLGKRKGHNYEVIVGDAFEHMANMRVSVSFTQPAYYFN